MNNSRSFNSGVALDAHKRIQVNVPLMQNDRLTYFKQVKNVRFLLELLKKNLE